jgi:hypothetical protein
LIQGAPPATGLENMIAKRFITAVGTACIAGALGSASFVFVCRVAASRNLSGANGIGMALLLSIAVGVWGIFALLLWGMPGKG